MDISVFRQVATIAGSGTLDILGDAAWAGGSVIEDDFAVYDSTDGGILLPAGWHDIGLTIVGQDADFVSSTILEARLGRYNSGVPVWSLWRERDAANTSVPKRGIRGAVEFPSQDYLAVGIGQNSGTTKDLHVEVQIFS